MADLRDKIILVTGGTGFIGRPLCGALAERGARIFVLTRSGARRDNPQISFISALSELGDSALDIIINLAGEPIAQRWTAQAKDKIRRSRMETTAAIIDLIKAAARKPDLLISASAIGYYGTDEEAEFDENTPPVASGAAFSRSLCAAWEAQAMRAEQYGVRTISLRIGAVLDKEGGMLGKLIPPFRMGLGGPIGKGRQWLSWICRADLIGLILHMIDTPALTGPLNATAPNPVRNSTFARSLAHALGRPCIFPTPAFALRLLFGDMADEIMLGGQKVMPKKAVGSGYQFLYPTLNAALRKICAAETGRR